VPRGGFLHARRLAESLADAVRQSAAALGTTISSVVEAALAEQIKWDKIRLDGLAAIEEEYEETGHRPTPEEAAAGKAQVDEEIRLLAEARAAMAAERGQREAGAA
jgi:predicted transcriptional regulator